MRIMAFIISKTEKDMEVVPNHRRVRETRILFVIELTLLVEQKDIKTRKNQTKKVKVINLMERLFQIKGKAELKAKGKEMGREAHFPVAKR